MHGTQVVGRGFRKLTQSTQRKATEGTESLTENNIDGMTKAGFSVVLCETLCSLW